MRAYNAALEERREAFKRGIVVRRFDQFAQLKGLHEPRPDFMGYGATLARGTLTCVDRAFAAFYRRVASGQRPGFPRFKAPSRFDCASYEDLSGWKLSAPPTGRQAGFDLGVVNLATSSEGEVFENPRDLAAGKQALAVAQQDLARKKRGSARRRKARERVGLQHRRIANRRRDAAHQLSRTLVNSYDVLVFEDLRIANICGFECNADLNAARNILRLGSSLRREKREAEAGAA